MGAPYLAENGALRGRRKCRGTITLEFVAANLFCGGSGLPLKAANPRGVDGKMGSSKAGGNDFCDDSCDEPGSLDEANVLAESVPGTAVDRVAVEAIFEDSNDLWTKQSSSTVAVVVGQAPSPQVSAATSWSPGRGQRINREMGGRGDSVCLCSCCCTGSKGKVVLMSETSNSRQPLGA